MSPLQNGIGAEGLVRKWRPEVAEEQGGKHHQADKLAPVARREGPAPPTLQDTQCLP